MQAKAICVAATGGPEVMQLVDVEIGAPQPSLVYYTAKRTELVASCNALFEMIRTGAVKAHIGQRYALTDAVQAHRDLEAGRTRGSTILLC